MTPAQVLLRDRNRREQLHLARAERPDLEEYDAPYRFSTPVERAEFDRRILGTWATNG